MPLVELTRQALHGRTRAQCLAIGATLGPVPHDLGGTGAVTEAVEAIRLAGT